MHGHLLSVFFQAGFLWEMIHLMRDLVIQMNIVMRMKIFLLMRHYQTLFMKLLVEESKHLRVMDEFNSMYNSFDMNYDTFELSEEAQRRIATIVTQ
ncbi:hypothetical protein Gotur_019521, partial [Gossypium turneri]